MELNVAIVQARRNGIRYVYVHWRVDALVCVFMYTFY